MKKMRYFAVVLAMLMMTSCGAAASKDTAELAAGDYSPVTTTAGHNGMSSGETAYDMSKPEKELIEMGGGENVAQLAAGENTSLQPTQVSEKKIIKNGSASIEADNVLESYQMLLDYVVSQGGYEFSQSLSNSSEYASLNAVVKIPPDKLDAVLEYANKCGKVVNVNVSMNDITMAYTDTEIRLQNKKKNLEKYYDYYEKASTLEEMIAIQTQIDSITAEIESYEGQLKYWNSQIDESTLNLYIQEAADPNKIPEDIDWSSLSLSSMGKLMRNGFTSVINGIVTFFQWIVIIIASLSPVLIAGGVIVFFAIKKRRKGKTKTALPKPQEAPEKPDSETK